jgi:iron complex outermembrane receptor protein
MSRPIPATVLAAAATTGGVLFGALTAHPAAAQARPAPRPASAARDTTPRESAAPRDSAVRLGRVEVTARRPSPIRVPALQALTLPVSASVTAAQAAVTTNVVDPQDVVKYLPSVFVRKRSYGDQGATLATRAWGTQSSARSLVYADGVLLTALLANNTFLGVPRWGMVAPIEISRVDMMYGPFSAAYAGNSMGAVMEITTRLPDRLEGALTQTVASQRYRQYGTRATYPTAQTEAAIGDRVGRLAVSAAGNYLDSRGQPLLFVTRAGAGAPSGTTGGYVDTDATGAPITFVGATSVPHYRNATGKLKLAYDLTSALRLTYSGGVWGNRTDAGVETYLTSAAGDPTYAGQPGFTRGYAQRETHTMHSLSLRTGPASGTGSGAAPRAWDVDVTASRYHFDQSRQRSAAAAPATGTTFAPAGRVAVYDGTGWTTLDLKGALHPGGADAARHTVSAGVHYDDYVLKNPTYATADWRDADAPDGALVSEGSGRTQTAALWAQDAWRLAPTLTLTVGGRLERWHTFDGVNASTNARGLTRVTQPARADRRFSPKGVLAWTPTAAWTVSGSVGKAYRFATVTELYQLVTTGPTYAVPAPDLRPDNVLATEWRAARRFAAGPLAAGGRPASASVALFTQDVRDAILPLQYVPLVSGSPTLYAVTKNVDYVRARGAELAFDVSPRPSLQFTGGATYLDARVYAADARGTATAPAGSTQGKFEPNVPKWRAVFTATVRPPLGGDGAGPERPLALTVAGRYSTKVFNTLDNSEVLFNRYFAFAEYFVADARATYRLGRGLTAAAGVDNLLDRQYFLFHPFPQRTLVASLQYGF